MKNNKGFVGIGIIIALIAVLVVGGIAYYVGKNKQASQPVTTSTSTSNYNSYDSGPAFDPTSTDPSISASNSNSQTADWKTYSSGSNYNVSFSVKYPPNWYVANSQTYVMFSSTTNSSGVQISIGPALSDSDFQNINTECRKITIGDSLAYSCVPSGIGAPYYYFLKGGYLVAITDFYQNDLSKELISTFKFNQ